MHSLEEAQDLLDGWFQAGCVGNIVFYRAPKQDHVYCIVEQTIKSREMPDDVRKSFERLMNHYQAERAEMFRKDGRPDRIKVVKEG